ncbi:uncharacterized protein LOC111831938 [Capsella rubella]|uniref:uncharacterized protein LOC111831938 n=1 Tax=Capsella rubella TaxID=81985 RepID=UPI000CD4B9C1|nr:uncharacterized protein LOC111831938 [Capsella rubella]
MFDPARGDTELPASRKRLRVEKGTVKRYGGSLTVDAAEIRVKELGMDSSLVEKVLNEQDGLYAVEEEHQLETSTGLEWRFVAIVQTCIGEMTIVESTNQFIHTKVVNEGEVINWIVVYAAPTASKRSGLWNRISDAIRGVDGPVVVEDEFSTILRLHERSGGNGRVSSDSLPFGEWIHELSLIEMGFKSNNNMWRRSREARRQLHISLFLHAPLLVQLLPEMSSNPRRQPSWFEAMFLMHPGFKELLLTSWNGSVSAQVALKKLQMTLRKWNKEVFGDVQRRKEKLLNEIKEIQEIIDMNQTDLLLKREAELLREFDLGLDQEEVLWFQKSREKWIVHGDRNTSFFIPLKSFARDYKSYKDLREE